MPQLLPLLPELPNYRFDTTLDGIQYVIDIRWNSRDEAWYMSVFSEEEEPLISGTKLVLGAWLTGDATHPDRPFGLFRLIDWTGSGTEATLTNIGSVVGLYFYNIDEIEETIA